MTVDELSPEAGAATFLTVLEAEAARCAAADVDDLQVAGVHEGRDS